MDSYGAPRDPSLPVGTVSQTLVTIVFSNGPLTKHPHPTHPRARSPRFARGTTIARDALRAGPRYRDTPGGGDAHRAPVVAQDVRGVSRTRYIDFRELNLWVLHRRNFR